MVKTRTLSGFDVITTTGTRNYDWSFSKGHLSDSQYGPLKNCPGNCQQTILEEISVSANTYLPKFTIKM